MHNRLVLFLCLLLVGCVSTGAFPVVRRPGDAPIYEFRNARWFDGTGFVEGTRYSTYGVLTTRPPAVVDSILDLGGAWVVPAFAEAHNHNAVPADTSAARRYLEAGIFFVKNPNNLPRERASAPAVFGTPQSIDVAFANGGLTGPGGHPIGLVRRNIERGVWQPGDGEGAFLHTVAFRADVERIWPTLLASRPDFVKTYLLFSDEYQQRLADSSTIGWRGLDPSLLPYIVQKARAASLRVATHVETAADFRAALAAGVDEIAHLPGFRPAGGTVRDWWPLERSRLTVQDARRAARQRVTVFTTVSEALELLAGQMQQGGSAADSAAEVRRVILDNLRVLRDAGVRLAIGSDRFRTTSAAEAFGLAATGIFSNLELLRMWAMATPQAVFPRRRLGSLQTAAEASFVALAGDPLADFENVRRITLRVKQGWLLKLAAHTSQTPSGIQQGTIGPRWCMQSADAGAPRP